MGLFEFKCTKCKDLEDLFYTLDKRIKAIELTHTNEYHIVSKVIDRMESVLPSNLHYIRSVALILKELQLNENSQK